MMSDHEIKITFSLPAHEFSRFVKDMERYTISHFSSESERFEEPDKNKNISGLRENPPKKLS
jgi:hypothetical protein